MHQLQIDTITVHNGAGWRLALKRTVCPSAFNADLRPVLIVPGYGMNGFIFGWHPGDRSMERCLAEAGFEVWTGTLRQQGDATPTSVNVEPPSLRAYAEVDVPALISAIVDATGTRHHTVDGIGASLGGSVLYAHVALVPDTPLRSVIAIGAPLRWETVPPLFKLAFRSRRVVGAVKLKGTQRMARAVFPLLARVPGALNIYMNTDHIDLANAGMLVQSVDDPHPVVNRNMASWFRARDMVLRGVNVTEALQQVQDRALLVVLANRDGIVPANAATSALKAWAGPTDVLEVGTKEDWYAHADLFIAPEAPDKVFLPMGVWLQRRQSPLESA